MINNIKLIKPLFNFEKKGDFYYLLILKRKKDFEDKENHQSVRTIKTYVIENIEYLDKKMDEITKLCELFKARAYININKQNNELMSLYMLETLAKRIREKNFDQKNLFDSCVGSLQYNERRWVVDLDGENVKNHDHICDSINKCQPHDIVKTLTLIPTKNGCHLITTPFNVEEFNKIGYRDIEIKKCNPTLLYYPNSLD